MSETIRAFIAFELPANIIRIAAAVQKNLRDDGLKMRWVRPQNIHLTLKFFGELPTDDIGSVTRAMTLAMQDKAAVTLTVQGLGVFPNTRRPRILWMGLGGEVDQLGFLLAALEESLSAEGFKRERRPFRPHLTLARIPDRFDSRRLPEAIVAAGDYNPQPLACSQLVLFQSRLDPRGAIYTPLARVALPGKVAGKGQ